MRPIRNRDCLLFLMTVIQFTEKGLGKPILYRLVPDLVESRREIGNKIQGCFEILSPISECHHSIDPTNIL